MQPLRLIILLFEILGLSILNCHALLTGTKPPHVVYILADDAGWNDFGVHGSNLFPTPNIDALFYNGVPLHQFHGASICTPSRAAIMTGRFPIHIGMQHAIIGHAEPWGLPTNLKILPQYLRPAGYESHLIGKWHLGSHDKTFLPTYRGFQSFFGCFQGYIDYWTHHSKEVPVVGNFDGYDFYKNLTPRKDLNGTYASDLINNEAVRVITSHDPSKPLFLMVTHVAPHAGGLDTNLQAPSDVIKKFNYIPDKDQRTYAAMVDKLDEGVGKIMDALSKKNMLANSVILFSSDNGGTPYGDFNTTSSNYPFRGQKATELEGGTRLSATIWSPLFPKMQYVNHMLMHSVDILPTFCTAAGIHPNEFKHIDGISMWETLIRGSQASPRVQYPYTIDPSDAKNSVGAVRSEDWKFYQGDASGNTTDYQYFSDKWANSLYEKYGYDTKKILQSPTNRAILKTYHDYKIPQQQLTDKKILQLRSQMSITCPSWGNQPKCDTTKSCLLDLRRDPCERYDWSAQYPDILKSMRQLYEYYRARVVPAVNKPRDACGNPDYYNGLWTPWYNHPEVLRKLAAEGMTCSVNVK